MKILVTGSAGQVGSYLVEHLRDSATVVGIDLKTCGIRDVDEITLSGDIRNKEDVDKAMKDVDKVVHCAAQVSVAASMEDPLEDSSHNVFGTLQMLNSAAAHGVDRFVQFSSAAIYGDPVQLPINEGHPKNPLSPYGASKIAAETYAMTYAAMGLVPATAIRPFNIYSARQDPRNPYSGVISRFLDKIRNGEAPCIYGDGNQTRDFIHVEDVLAMVDLLLTKKSAVGQPFNCATGQPTKINDLANTLLEIMGKDTLKLVHQDIIPGEIYESWGDIGASREELGFTPNIGLEKGLRRLVSGE